MMKMVIDPGHGGEDPGVVAGQLREKDLTLQLALRMRGYLTSRYRVHVYMTRTTDRTLRLRERVSLINHHYADFFCSLHINSGKGHGLESYVSKSSSLDQSIEVQHRIHTKVISLLAPYKIMDRGMKQADMYLLHYAMVPGIHFECLFIDTVDEQRYLQNHSFMTKLGNAMGEGIAKALQFIPRRAGIVYRIIAGSFNQREQAVALQKYLRLGGIDSMIMNVGASHQCYQVQAGAFQVRSNAEARLQDIKDMGFLDAYIG
ncbi:N-acetylmuramoyl-L-alanine amidase [Marininema halotolerans]|uniref:N-acetylmuramoyl-L-alanine amidase n=1 Tax=Marininema halotolerans TaxID=1155944 RepID=A0A1I6R2X5_9BACL|nr:N-acetylmuramoyl-L-alanine amidase [Marininema halotolerans]SFS59036.1 N-acetylmuramoyl-L-alanine amidase [Marininema halotolerans]